MSIPIPLRADFNASRLRRCARDSKGASQARRLLALIAIYAGGMRTQAAEVGGVGLPVVRDWVVRLSAEGPTGLIDKKAPSHTPFLKTAHRCALARMVDDSAIPAVPGVVRWRLVDLVQWIWEKFRIVVSETTMGRVLNEMGYRKLSARGHDAQNPDAMDVLKRLPRRRGEARARQSGRQNDRDLVRG